MQKDGGGEGGKEVAGESYPKVKIEAILDIPKKRGKDWKNWHYSKDWMRRKMEELETKGLDDWVGNEAMELSRNSNVVSCPGGK